MAIIQRSLVGTILNKSASLVRISANFKTAATYVPGLVYEEAAGDWRMAKTDGSQEGRVLYWLETGFVIASGDAAKKVTVYDLNGLMVVGKNDGVIAPDDNVKAGTTVGGSLIVGVINISTVTTSRDTSLDLLGKYIGKEIEIRDGVVVRSSTADLDTDGVYILGRSG